MILLKCMLVWVHTPNSTVNKTTVRMRSAVTIRCGLHDPNCNEVLFVRSL